MSVSLKPTYVGPAPRLDMTPFTFANSSNRTALLERFATVTYPYTNQDMDEAALFGSMPQWFPRHE
jgi:hypothetical protein